MLALATVPLATVAAPVAADDSQPTQRVQTREYDQKLRQVREAYEAHDWDRAYRLSSETARWGDKWSQFVLGSLYLDGKGGANENVLLAYGWMAAAAESGIDEFADAAARLREAIPAQHHPEADGAARALIARYGMDATGVRCEKRRPTGSNRRVLDCRKPHSMSDEWVEVPAYESAALAQRERD
jgi:hypothetical protein